MTRIAPQSATVIQRTPPAGSLRTLAAALTLWSCLGCGDSTPGESGPEKELTENVEAKGQPQSELGESEIAASGTAVAEAAVREVDMATLQYRRDEIAVGATVKVTGEVSRISFGEPTKQGPHIAVWLDSHVFGDGYYDVECRFDSCASIAGLVEGQTITLQGARKKSPFGIGLEACRIIKRAEAPKHTAKAFENPVAESSLEFPEAPEGIELKAYLPYTLGIDAEAILEDGSLNTSYMSALAESLVVRNVEVKGSLSNQGLKQIAELKGMKDLRISPGLGGDPIDISQLDFTILADHPRLRTLTMLNVEGVTDDAIISFGKFQCLANIVIHTNKASITDSGLAGLANLKSLRSFMVSHSFGDVDVTDDGISAFAGLPYLRELRLRSRKFTGSGFASLKDCSNLEVLRLRRCSVTVEGLASLTKLPQLRYLELDETKVDDGIASVVSKLQKLEHLGLGATEITDAFFETWQPPPELAALDVSKTKLTDRGVKLLSESPANLRFLGLRHYGDGITSESLESVKRITTLKSLIAPNSFDDDARESLYDLGIAVR